MTKPPATKVVSTTKVEAGRRSAEGRERDAKGRLLPRSSPPEPEPTRRTPRATRKPATKVKPTSSPPEPPPTPEPEPQPPPFRELRRRWSPIYRGRRSKGQGQ